MPPVAAKKAASLFKHRLYKLEEDVVLEQDVVVDTVSRPLATEVVFDNEDDEEVNLLEEPKNKKAKDSLKRVLMGGRRFAGDVKSKGIITTPTGVMLIRRSSDGKYTACRMDSLSQSKLGIDTSRTHRWVK